MALNISWKNLTRSVTIIFVPFNREGFAQKWKKPNTNVICVKTEPIESLTSIFPYPIMQETKESTISGRSVPIDTSAPQSQKPYLVSISISVSEE